MKKNVLSVRMYDTTFDKLRQLEYLEKEKENLACYCTAR